MKLGVIVAFFNEEATLNDFLKNLRDSLISLNCESHLFFVNDGSIDNGVTIINQIEFPENIKITLIDLKSNIGQQGAFKVCLNHISQINIIDKFDGLLFLDSDGEDNPYEIPNLISLKGNINFAVRGKRSEGLTFRFFYYLYQLFFKIITGSKMNFGNFLFIRSQVYPSLVNNRFNHLSAFLSKTKFEKEYITIDRSKRYNGKSKVGFKGLLVHGLNSLIEYSDEVIFFLFKCLVLVLIFGLFIFIWVIKDRFIQGIAIPGWSSLILISALSIIIQIFGFMVLLLFMKNIRASYIQNINAVS